MVNWDRVFVRTLGGMACLALASLGIAAIEVAAGNVIAATWYAVAAFELLLLGSIAFILYAMVLLL